MRPRALAASSTSQGFLAWTRVLDVRLPPLPSARPAARLPGPRSPCRHRPCQTCLDSTCCLRPLPSGLPPVPSRRASSPLAQAAQAGPQPPPDDDAQPPSWQVWRPPYPPAPWAHGAGAPVEGARRWSGRLLGSCKGPRCRSPTSRPTPCRRPTKPLPCSRTKMQGRPASVPTVSARRPRAARGDSRRSPWQCTPGTGSSAAWTPPIGACAQASRHACFLTASLACQC
mmetsp:Transcript_133094/g.284501  ORF Transcript_133094/g.284501 Transcript_133094/m.284501 type:complete len:228 (+) Transcript_133094:105-788(+)